MHPTDDLAHRAGLIVAHAAAQAVGSGAGERNKATPHSDERVSGSFFVPHHKAVRPPRPTVPLHRGTSVVISGVVQTTGPLAGYTLLPAEASASPEAAKFLASDPDIEWMYVARYDAGRSPLQISQSAWDQWATALETERLYEDDGA